MNLIQFSKFGIFLIIFIECSFFKDSNKIAVELTSLKACDNGSENLFNYSSYLRKYNRTHVAITDYFNVTEAIGPEFNFHVIIRVWGDGGWKNTGINIRKEDLCNTISILMGPAWKTLLEAHHFTKFDCPILPGEYHAENYYLDLRQVPVFYMPGRFQIVMTMEKNNHIYVCADVTIEIKV